MKTFRRADFCVQNFPDDKKVHKLKFCDKKVHKLDFNRKMHIWNNKKTRPHITWKCSRSKTIRPRKLKSTHHVDHMRSTWYELFCFLCIIVLDLQHFKILVRLVFCLFSLYSHLMVCFIFLYLYYTDPFKILSMKVNW